MIIDKSKFSEKIINIILNVLIVLFGIILLISFYTSFQVKVLKHKYSNFFGYTIFEVQTPSMKKAISAGDWIIVKLDDDIELGDIITYEKNGEFITHRVVEFYSDTYITRGDANTGNDDPVDKSQIVGKVTNVLRGFGILRKTLFNPFVLLFLIISIYLFNSIMKKDTRESVIDKKIKLIIEKIKNKFNKIKIKDEIIDLTSQEEKANLFDIENILNKNKTSQKLEFDLPKLKEADILEIEPEKIVEEIEDEIKSKELAVEQKDVLLENIAEKTEEEIDEELSKTSMFRVIPVDMSEIDETFLEIAKNELEIANKEEAQKEKEAAKKEDVIQEEVSEEDNTINLELINNSIKKSKNVIDKLINIKKEEILEICLLFDDKIEINDSTIRNSLMETYIYAKYYNYYNENNLEYKGRRLIKKIENVIDMVSTEMEEKYEGPDKNFGRKVKDYNDIFHVITNLDHASNSINETKAKREFFKDQILKYYDWDNLKIEESVNKIIKIQKKYNKILNFFLDQLKTNTFSLIQNKIVYRKNLFAVDVDHNIAFSNVYSDYIINKTYTEGIIAEDKIQVLFTLLMSQLVDDMMNANFKNKYIAYMPPSLYKKVRKINSVLQLIDDEYAKSHIYLLIDFEEFKENHKQIKKIKKSGYKFAISIDEKSQLNATSKSLLELAELIFINKKDLNYANIISYIPKDLIDKIAYDDIFSKLKFTEVKK